MFTFLFKYPWAVFRKGTFVLASGWPAWLLWVSIAAGAALIGAVLWRQRHAFKGLLTGWRGPLIWALQSAALAMLLLLLWQPALSVSTLKSQQNMVAVVLDDSRSMGITEDGKKRIDVAREAVDGKFIDALRKKFQVKLYRMGARLEPIAGTAALQGSEAATHIGDAVRQAVGEAATLPVGAVVLVTDGADNSGGIDTETASDIRRYRIPIHSIGIGRERLQRDLEVTGVEVAQRAISDSRLTAMVSYRQAGFAGRKAKLAVRDGGKLVASREITLKADGAAATEPVVFSAGAAGAKTLQVGVELLDGEENAGNNAVSRVVNVESRKPRVLYIEGEPRWEMKFIRRAIEEDKNIELTSIVRTTQNKFYRQGIRNTKELEDGFPAKVEELFEYEGLIIGTVEAAYFTPAQQDLIKEFVDRRGGGLLVLGGRASLSDGGWNRSTMADLLPVTLTERKGTFHREPAVSELTAQGRESLICRLEEDPDKNVARWKALPYLADYQESGVPKPGAVVLAELVPTSKGRFPLLVTQNYGRGRVALFATGGSWRWQMLQDSKDKTHEMFWQQLIRWIASDSPGRAVLSSDRTVLEDSSKIKFRVEARDPNYSPVQDATVTVRLLGPEGIADEAVLRPDAAQTGVYQGEWSAPKPGSYLAEAVARRGAEEIGRDVLTFQRQDGVAENFRVEQNRELLEKLAQQTGGSYHRPAETSQLLDEISLSEAGLTVRENRDLWDMPFFLLLLACLLGGQWLLRRKWGMI